MIDGPVDQPGAFYDATLSETGRRLRNEDVAGAWRGDDRAIWALADGAGGHADGAEAARRAVAAALEAVRDCGEADLSVVASRALDTAHAAVAAARAESGSDMATTLAL